MGPCLEAPSAIQVSEMALDLLLTWLTHAGKSFGQRSCLCHSLEGDLEGRALSWMLGQPIALFFPLHRFLFPKPVVSLEVKWPNAGGPHAQPSVTGHLALHRHLQVKRFLMVRKSLPSGPCCSGTMMDRN